VLDRDGKWDIDSSIDACNFPVSTRHPLLVEQKYNGNRGIFEYNNGHGCLASGKHGCHDNGFPAKIARLIEHQFDIAKRAGERIDDVILDGEMYLEDCNGKIPGLAKQARAIKGSHQDIERDCIFSYKVYDIIKLNGKDLSNVSLAKRKEAISEVIPYTFMDSGKGISIDPVKGMEATSPEDIATITKNLVGKGYEGIVVKDPSSMYKWARRSAENPSTDGWWKIKNTTATRVALTHACLGNIGKTGINAMRYRVLGASACKNKSCKELVPITTKGVSHSATGGEFDSVNKWDDGIHYPIVRAIEEGKAKPMVDEWRFAGDVARRLNMDPSPFDRLAGNITKDGKSALPRCVSLPGTDVVSIDGVEFDVNEKGIPKIVGPPRIIARRQGMSPSTIKEILELPATHV
jgi:ATP-dependent DNA ligase